MEISHLKIGEGEHKIPLSPQNLRKASNNKAFRGFLKKLQRSCNIGNYSDPALRPGNGKRKKCQNS